MDREFYNMSNVRRDLGIKESIEPQNFEGYTGAQMLGQTLFAGEWLFDGAEAKVPAYALVFAGLALAIDRKYIGAAFLFVCATYFHFLVGIFWFFAAMALALIEDCSERQRPLFATAVFLLLVAPLLGLHCVY